MKKLALAFLVSAFAITPALACDKHKDQHEHAIQQASKISYEDAKTRAVAAVGGGVAVKIEFEMKKSGNYYEIDVKNGTKKYEVHIDADTGQVLKKKLDR